MSEEEYSLVMPFVAVASKGGPYDDDAYVAGYEIGTLDRDLEAKPDQHRVTIRTANTAQADLLAMRHGYHCTSELHEEAPQWTTVTFEPAAEEAR